MTEKLLFDSVEDPIPHVRENLQVIPVHQESEKILCFYDVLKHVPSNFALNAQVESILSLLNGRISINDMASILGENIEATHLKSFIKLLDKNCILHSDYYKAKAEQQETAFEHSPVRPAVLAGEVYPDNPDELVAYLDSLFGDVEQDVQSKPGKALYAPHIDPGVGSSVYAKSFIHLRNVKPERVVILATSHYAGYYPDSYQNTPFIGSEKIFEMPLSPNPVDRDYVRRLTEKGDRTGFTVKDRAHRIEHSIELHLLFLNYIWKHNFQIVPILVNSFEELYYLKEGSLGKQIRQFTNQLKEMDDQNTFYLISGDLSHVGNKFGDQTKARDLRPEVELFDKKFLEYASQNQREELYKHIQQEYDPYRICGFPPLYTFLQVFPEFTGEIIDYFWWDEAEFESAVSFGSISY